MVEKNKKKSNLAKVALNAELAEASSLRISVIILTASKMSVLHKNFLSLKL